MRSGTRASRRISLVPLLLAVVADASAAPGVAGALRGPAQAPVAGDAVEIEGYADFRHGGTFIVDGQRVRVGATTAISGAVVNPSEIELGFSVRAGGIRAEDGAILAEWIEASPNGLDPFQTQAFSAAEEIEREWLRARVVYEPGSDGRTVIGDIVSFDDRVVRIERITAALRPAYLLPGEIRLHLVETERWNAVALANGSIWVYAGLVEALSDDELAVVLGHELAHYTYEHSRRGARSSLWTQLLAGLGASLVAGALPTGFARDAAGLATLLGTTAFASGYSRELEDQADRVGLRYAHEAGYDVRMGPVVWDRFRSRYGDGDPVSNFLLGSHSRPSERIENLLREIELNYPER